MATIEERAKEYAQAYSPKESAVQWCVERAYGIGASDQKKIDIEKAWSITKSFLSGFNLLDGEMVDYEETFRQTIEL